jgi:hypothetical protein
MSIAAPVRSAADIEGILSALARGLIASTIV